jgi:hypothetical protein
MTLWFHLPALEFSFEINSVQPQAIRSNGSDQVLAGQTLAMFSNGGKKASMRLYARCRRVRTRSAVEGRGGGRGRDAKMTLFT